MSAPLATNDLAQLFTDARTFSYWQEKKITPEIIHQLYELAKFGPTGANACPARFVFITSPEAKEQLKPCMDEGNIQKTMTAPLTVIIGMDVAFYEQLPTLFPHADAKSWFIHNNLEKNRAIALRDSSLQGAYLIMAARSLGLDCGPMGGFNAAKVNDTFFANTSIEVNFICNIGYGKVDSLHPRLPRLTFEQAAQII